MNRRMIFNVVGKIICLEGALMALPLVCALLYLEWRTALSFAATIAGALLIGYLMIRATKNASKTIYAKDGFVICTFAWIALSLLGAVPFVISGDIPNYVDALFETVSGLTTTGASILTNVEALSRGSLLWRSFTHWIGGMGVLVLMVAIIPADNDRTMHIMRAEMPGPVVDKIVPRMRDTAKILYLIYIGLTALQIVFLLCGGLSFYESLICAFGTAGTGGFFIRSDSLASLSPYVQWVIAAFLVLFGINFNVFFLILARRFRQALRSEETWLYLGIFAVSTAVIAINISGLYQTVEETMRHSAFQVISMMSTAGFATTNFDLWPQLAKNVMFVLMFIGGCAGSTAGGLKVSRILILFKVICRELKTILRPRTAAVLKIDGKRVPDSTADGITSYLALYFVIFLSAFLLISFEPFDFLTNISAVNTCFNNVGPGFSVIGPMGSFAGYTVFSKIVLALTMLLGRLEIYPIILTVYSLTRRHSK